MTVDLNARITQVTFRRFKVYCKFCNGVIKKHLERHGINNEFVLKKRRTGFYTCFRCKTTRRQKNARERLHNKRQK